VADLADDTAKLVYADWLEEHDDPRGPFLREFVTATRRGNPPPPSDVFPKPWRDLVGVTLVEAARTHRLAARIDTFLGLARPALGICEGADPSSRVGHSRHGGIPDLPPGAAWPTRMNGQPLAFLAQVNLADLVGSVVARDLPNSGLFSVFYDRYHPDLDTKDYDGTDPDGWRLFYFPEPDQLLARELPAGLSEYGRFDPFRLTFTEYLTLPPGYDSPWEADLGFGNDAAKSAYFTMEGSLFPESGDNRLLGHNPYVEGDRDRPKTLRHLWTIGPTEHWLHADGDVRILRFTIEEAGLRGRRFDRVRHEAYWLR